MRFFTSDHHFGHANAISYCARPFESVEEMDRVMIQKWNAVVGKREDVFYLGDLSFHDAERTKKILDALNGRIYLIQGNHDYRKRYHLWDRFEWVKDYYELNIRPEPRASRVKVVLCHYAFEVWNKAHYGSWHLHGHSHGSLTTYPNSARLDVGADTNNFTPYSETEVINLLRNKEINVVDHHTPRGET